MQLCSKPRQLNPRMSNRQLVIAAGLIALGSIGIVLKSENDQLTSQGDPKQWLLPDELNEASGLAVLDQDTVLVHNDETARLYRIGLADQYIEVLGQIGEPPIDEDLEGVAVRDRDIYLVNSTGVVFRIADVDFNRTNQSFPADSFDLGLTELCEMEGLAHEDGALLLPCKTALHEKYQDQLVVFRYQLDSGELDLLFAIADAEIKGITDSQPTAIETTSDAWLILVQQHLLEVSRSTLAVNVHRLDPIRHRQPEGLAVLPDGGIIIVDDRRKGIGKLTRYAGLNELTRPIPANRAGRAR